jgi:hypothetical protein
MFAVLLFTGKSYEAVIWLNIIAFFPHRKKPIFNVE